MALCACKMGNPAFELMDGDSGTGSGAEGSSSDDGAGGSGGGGGGSTGGSTDGSGHGGGGTTGGDGGSTDGGGTTDDGGGTTDDGGSTTGDDGGTDTTGDATTTAPLCDYGRTPPIDIKLGTGPQNGTCAHGPAGYFRVEAPIANGWTLQSCAGDGCTACDPSGRVDFTVWPLDPQNAVNQVGCFWLDFESLYDDSDGCRYEGVTAWRQGEQTETPVMVGSTRSYGTPVSAYDPLEGFSPELAFLWECDCAEVDDVPMCCTDDPPAAYGFLTQGMTTKPGETAAVTLGFDQKTFLFHNVQSYFRGICGTAINEAWALVRP